MAARLARAACGVLTGFKSSGALKSLPLFGHRGGAAGPLGRWGGEGRGGEGYETVRSQSLSKVLLDGLGSSPTRSNTSPCACTALAAGSISSSPKHSFAVIAPVSPVENSENDFAM